eukprot:scaffold506822_cov18-Prasinocladus_malaysianus.AAC.1
MSSNILRLWTATLRSSPLSGLMKELYDAKMLADSAMESEETAAKRAKTAKPPLTPLTELMPTQINPAPQHAAGATQQRPIPVREPVPSVGGSGRWPAAALSS